MPATHKLIVKDTGWDEIVKEHKKLDGVKVKVGLFGSGDPDSNLAARGAIQTFGAKITITDKMRGYLHFIGIHVKKTTTQIIIPKRPFMQNAMDMNEANLLDFIKKQYILFLNDKINLNMFLNRIGLKHTDQIKLSIKRGNYAKLHPVTTARKGSSKPLIDSGEMLQGVKHKVDK